MTWLFARIFFCTGLLVYSSYAVRANKEIPMLNKIGDTQLYFGYGSNLWKEQMSLRCPESTYLGVARLPGYRWIIYDRGYANIVKTSTNSTSTERQGDEVFALVYSLTRSDESRLDRNEGVPRAYQKDILDVEFWPAKDGQPVDVNDRGSMLVQKTLVYIDHTGTTEASPKHEYVYRMVSE